MSSPPSDWFSTDVDVESNLSADCDLRNVSKYSLTCLTPWPPKTCVFVAVVASEISSSSGSRQLLLIWCRCSCCSCRRFSSSSCFFAVKANDDGFFFASSMLSLVVAVASIFLLFCSFSSKSAFSGIVKTPLFFKPSTLTASGSSPVIQVFSHFANLVFSVACFIFAIITNASSLSSDRRTQSSMALKTSAPVWPMINPTNVSCSSIVKCSSNNGHNSSSSFFTCVSKETFKATHVSWSFLTMVPLSSSSNSSTSNSSFFSSISSPFLFFFLFLILLRVVVLFFFVLLSSSFKISRLTCFFNFSINDNISSNNSDSCSWSRVYE